MIVDDDDVEIPGMSDRKNDEAPIGKKSSSSNGGELRIGQGDLEGPLADPNEDPEAAGMLVGPGHPMFRRPTRQDDGDGGRRDDFSQGGDFVIPPSSVPPGARFDPIVPDDDDPSSFVHGSGDPDPDEFLPPGRRIQQRPNSSNRGNPLFGPSSFNPPRNPFN